MIPRGYPSERVTLRTRVKLAPWFVLVVVVWGYCSDHHVHDARGFVLAVATDLSHAVEQAGKPHKPTRLHANSPPLAKAAPPSADIPSTYLALYQAGAHSCPGLSWTVLAGIGKVETDHGRSTLPGVHSGENFAGAGGPMQFLSGTWRRYGRGGDRYDPADAIPAAARLLCANGAPHNLRRAIFAYNPAWWYVDQVIAFARSYQAGGR